MEQAFGVNRQAGNPVSGFRLKLVSDVAFTLDHDNRLQARPTVMLANNFKSTGIGQRPTAPNFNAPVRPVGGLPETVRHILKVRLLRPGEPFLNVVV